MKVNFKFKGMKKFSCIWASQFLSVFGSGLTRFGVIIWAYQQTGSATSLSLLSFFATLPYVLISPLAGALVDRWDRRRVLIFSDLAAGAVTLGLLLLFLGGHLQIWHLYLSEALLSLFGAFQDPAFESSVTLLVPTDQLTRANGMLSVATNGSRIFAPVMGGLLVNWIGLGGIMGIDLATCLAATLVLAFLSIPRPVTAQSNTPDNRQLWQNMAFGFRYIHQHSGLQGILLIFCGVNLFAALTYFGVMPAMILARSGGNELALSTVQAVLGAGGVVGGVLISLHGGPKNRVNGFLFTNGISFLMGDFLFAVSRSIPVWVLAALVSSLFIPYIVSCYQALWQSLVPADVQGRVFAAKNMVQVGSMPLAYLVAGPLADNVFEPAMQPGGSLAGIFGPLVGSGPGAGMGLMFLGTCVMGVTISIIGYLSPSIRNLEKSV
ncbi:arabinose efflux permease [Longilinea arvoryzae]|uniref:Arabinose efflux permease n=1 Tax=Longilinea arvoryzae TaxID=360412 RepID=A0A0S7BP99_9CHLR|nr:MFS transporter [Longilinea arvoryzae]GAP15637.1 arabinose efflux permease [Longilinea arvoryzae]